MYSDDLSYSQILFIMISNKKNDIGLRINSKKVDILFRLVVKTSRVIF